MAIAGRCSSQRDAHRRASARLPVLAAVRASGGQVTDETRLLTAEELPPRFEYPKLLLRMVDARLKYLEPWFILEGDLLRQRYQGLKDRFPGRLLVPFAARQDCDDIACWSSAPPKVHVVHDFAKEGWQDRGSFDDINAWLRAAVDDFIQFD